MALKILTLERLQYFYSKIKALIDGKQDKGSYVSYTTNSNITAGKKSGTTYTYGQSPMVVSNGIIIGGTAAEAGLVTRGISGVTTPSATGACKVDNLYINYDSDNKYGRAMVLGAGSAGNAVTTSTAASTTATNVYGQLYSAVRGDQMVNYVRAMIPTVPTTLKNPYSLTVTVDGTSTTYDGSAAQTIEITTATASDDTPDYVLTAADELAAKVTGHVGGDSIVFAVMADAHLGYYTDTENAAGEQAGQALKRLNERCALDYVAHVGDYSTGAWDTTATDALQDHADYQLLIGSKFPGRAIWCAGNHDDAPCQATAGRLTQTQMYAAIGRKNLASGGYVPDNACYGYMDFPGLKLRVIYLDTHDRRDWGSTATAAGGDSVYLNAENISATQLQYLADTALDFTGITDPSQWSIIVFSHAALNGTGSFTDPVSSTVYPSDTSNAATILKAYATKQSGSITHGTTVSYDFTAITPAQIIACIHGHDHCYTNETVGGAFLSIGCPNVMNGRERASSDGTTYTKTADSANGTSFCVFSVNRTGKKIYVDHYGAGFDQEFTYTVLDPNAPTYTNQLPLATDTDGSIYNGTGWASGYRLGSSGTLSGQSGSYVTGFIPVALGDIVRLQNVTWQYGVTSGITSSIQRISFYDVNKAHLGQTNGTGVGGTLAGVKDDNNIWTQFTVKSFSGATLDTVAYFRLSCAGLSDESIITVNEEIADA